MFYERHIVTYDEKVNRKYEDTRLITTALALHLEVYHKYNYRHSFYLK